jgi:DNA invertase Pin-like site-specific DNA recombinase
MIVGYARVSTDGQSLESQQSALTAAGATLVYAEKISGAVKPAQDLDRWRMLGPTPPQHMAS